jgi:hypothetical protein
MLPRSYVAGRTITLVVVVLAFLAGVAVLVSGGLTLGHLIADHLHTTSAR